MTRSEVVDIVLASISQQFGVARERLNEGTVASDVAGWDSFAHGQLLLIIEMNLRRPLPVERLFGANNVGELVDAIGGWE